VSYMPRTVLDKDGKPVTIAVPADGTWPPPDVTPPPADFLQAQPPSTYDALRDPSSVPGGMSQQPPPQQPGWMDELFSAHKGGVDQAGATTPVDWKGLGETLKKRLNPQQGFVGYGPDGKSIVAGTPTGAPPAADASAKYPARPPAYGGSGLDTGTGAPPGMEGASLRVKGALGGGGGMGGGGFAKDEKAAKAIAEREKLANETAFRVGQQQAHVEAGFAQDAAGLAERQRQEAVEFEKHRGDALDAQFKAYQTASDEVAKVNTTIDPNKFWASKVTGSRLLAALGAAMGGFGAALTGGPNYALEIINKAVNDDIDAQKSMVDYQLKKGNEKVAGQQTLYGMMRSRFGDDATALAATQAAALNVVQKKLDAAKAGLGTQEQKAKLEQLQVQVDARQQAAMQQLHMHADESAQKWAHERTERDKVALEFSAKAAKANGKDPETFVPGMGFALDKDAAKLVRAEAAQSDKLTSKIDRLIALREKNGAEMLDREAVAQMQSLSKDLMTDLAQQKKLGAISKDDATMLEALAGGDASRIGYVLPALKSVRQSVQEDLSAFATRHMDPRTYTSPKAAAQAVGFKAR
jgi:hypothetical protein